MQKRVDAHVVSVGNITVGGTGKTPVTEYVARRHIAAGRRVAILSRGYGRPDSSKYLVVVSDGHELLVPDWRQTGDEPQLLARHVPQAAVIVCPDRVKSARMAVADLGADLILLDDGFQHMRLDRDEDIVVLDATQPLDSLSLLPRGTLREPASALARATTIILTHADRCDDIEETKADVRGYAGKTPIVCTRHKTTGARAHPDDSTITDFAGRKVVAFSALGNPSGFERSVSAAGATISGTVRFPDHHVYKDEDMEKVRLALDEHGAEMAVTTEKDAIRLPASDTGFPVSVLAIEIEVTSAPTGDQSIWKMGA
jgi:tetraacyldisaccharide 4'-kinase